MIDWHLFQLVLLLVGGISVGGVLLFRRIAFSVTRECMQQGIGSIKSLTEFRTGLVTILFQWLREKWYLSCRLAQDPEKTEEKSRILDTCKRMWDKRLEIQVLPKYRILFNEAQWPFSKQSVDYLRAWLETRELAIKEYAQYTPSRTQSSIMWWLQRRPAWRVNR